MKKIIFPLIILVLFVGQCSKKEYTDYVNPFIGTGGKGHTYPGASVPHGMVQLSPDNGYSGWDRISGYFYPDTIIGSFSHTHFSGTGIGDLYDIAFMPAVPPLKYGNQIDKDELGVYSSFSHDKEWAEPGYYTVYLEDYNIRAEMTASKRVGFHRYTFPETKQALIFLNLARSMNWDNTTDTQLEIIGEKRVQGYRFSKGWAKNQKVFFVAEFSQPFYDHEIDTTIIKNEDDKEIGQGYIGKYYFDTREEEKILVKVGISPVSIEGAKRNLQAEVPHWNFRKVRKEATQKWRSALSKIDVKIDDRDNKIQFYTALYQSMLAPTIFSDVDGRYFGPDYKIHKAQDFNNYSTFSLWDTFRAAHPLYTILQPGRVNDMVKSMLQFYKQHGKLPQWAFYGNETNCMIGYHAVPVIIDAFLKGIRDYDTDLAWEACYQTAMSDLGSLPVYREYDYVPSNKAHGSVSKTVEYAFDDWCVARLAEKKNKTSVAQEFYERAANYRNNFDESTGFMRGK
ncbi:MAG TPA: GH92 family glycosyl hydrolase, partial [bacterium]|nr:GH92 family glycosyl hydrolase [bacterium]